MPIRIFLLLLLLLPQAAFAEKLQVVASFSIIGDMAQQVAGNHADIRTLVAPGSDTHAYEPTPGDVRNVARAELVIINGLGFEGWMAKLITTSGYQGPVVVASQHARLRPGDPHAWQSIGNGKAYVAIIRDALSAADPRYAAQYRANAARYLKELDALEAWVKATLAPIAPEHRRAITSHEAFGYFAEAYGVEFIAPLGLSTDAQATAADIARLVDQIRARQVRALFLESITDSRLIRQLEADGGVAVGGTLYSDSLSREDGPAASYVAMFRHNTALLAAAMGQNPR